MNASSGDEPYVLKPCDDHVSTTKSSISVNSEVTDDQEEGWCRVLKEHVMEFGTDFSNSVFNLVNEMQMNNMSLNNNWIPSKKAPFDVPPYIAFLDFEQKVNVDNPEDSKKSNSRFTTFTSRLGVEKWNEFLNDVNSIHMAHCKAKLNVSYLYSWVSTTRSLITKGSTKKGFAKRLTVKILKKWINIMEEKNMSILLFYNPGQIETRNKDEKTFGKVWGKRDGKYYFGFILQMHFDLIDVKNHFNTMKVMDQRVGLESKISTIRSVYRSRGDEEENHGMISNDIKQSLRKEKGLATPTFSSNANCMCVYDYDQLMGTKKGKSTLN